MRDEDDPIEQVLEFESRRAKFQLWMAGLDVDEAIIVARDVARMLEYLGNSVEAKELNRQLLAGQAHSQITATSYSPAKNGDAA